MSDTFDHKLDALESKLNDLSIEDCPSEKDNENPITESWECGNCGAWHPASHQSCWYCKNK